MSRLKNFLRYYTKSQTIYSVHSPYLYDLISTVFDFDKSYYDFYNIELIRSKMLKDETQLDILDLGAGSTQAKPKRSVSEIAKTSTSNNDKCKLLHNLCLYFQPQNILELGTNLGIATAYLHAACKGANFHTVEGDRNLAELAKGNFHQLGFGDIHLFNDPFDDYLISEKAFVDKVDFAYIDGNHRGDATLKYFYIISKNSCKKKVIILDDIYWSNDMYDAWQIIKTKVSCGFTIDFYKMGIVIIDPEYPETKHFNYIPWKYKPFSIGIFG